MSDFLTLNSINILWYHSTPIKNNIRNFTLPSISRFREEKQRFASRHFVKEVRRRAVVLERIMQSHRLVRTRPAVFVGDHHLKTGRVATGMHSSY